MGDFVDTPMSSEFVRTDEPKGSPGVYDGDDCPPFSEFRRTKSPNGVPEKVKLGNEYKITPEGEADQF